MYYLYKILLHSITGDDIPEARDTNTNVVPYCAPNWRELGEALGMTAFQLDIINADHLNSCEERCKVMLQNWLKKDASATWGKLIDAVGILQTVSSVLSTTANGMVVIFQLSRIDLFLVGFECVCKESDVRVARGMLVVSCEAIVIGAAGSLSDMVAMACYKCGYAYTHSYNSINTSFNYK